MFIISYFRLEPSRKITKFINKPNGRAFTRLQVPIVSKEVYGIRIGLTNLNMLFKRERYYKGKNS